MTRTTAYFLALVVFSMALAGMPSTALGQTSVSKANVVTETVTVQAIDQGARLVTIKNDAGLTETVYVGKEFVRFNELKVGDKVTFKVTESVVFAIQKPGSLPPPAASAAVTRSQGPRPGGTVAHQQTAVVTLKAIDAAIPSVTITTADGNTMSFKIEDKKNLEGFKVGDKVQITYTQALAISVDSPKK